MSSALKAKDCMATVKKKKKKKKRCSHPDCRQKLSLTDMACRCTRRFCIRHRLPESHSCTYNFKNEPKDVFMKRVGLGGGKACKIEAI